MGVQGLAKLTLQVKQVGRLKGSEFDDYVTCMIGHGVNGSLGAHNDRGRKPIGVRDDKRAIRSLNKIAKV